MAVPHFGCGSAALCLRGEVLYLIPSQFYSSRSTCRSVGNNFIHEQRHGDGSHTAQHGRRHRAEQGRGDAAFELRQVGWRR